MLCDSGVVSRPQGFPSGRLAVRVKPNMPTQVRSGFSGCRRQGADGALYSRRCLERLILFWGAGVKYFGERTGSLTQDSVLGCVLPLMRNERQRPRPVCRVRIFLFKKWAEILDYSVSLFKMLGRETVIPTSIPVTSSGFSSLTHISFPLLPLI